MDKPIPEHLTIQDSVNNGAVSGANRNLLRHEKLQSNHHPSIPAALGSFFTGQMPLLLLVPSQQFHSAEDTVVCL